jgi:hypothetical protein
MQDGAESRDLDHVTKLVDEKKPDAGNGSDGVGDDNWRHRNLLHQRFRLRHNQD